MARQNTDADQAVRLALIGCGLWGRNIARNVAALGLLEAVCDSERERAASFARDFSCAAREWQAVLEDDRLDGVLIAASAAAHESLAIQALQAGKHIFVEKPLALSLPAAQRICRVADETGRQVMVGHLIRYHPAFAELCRQIEAGAIGQLRHIQANRLAMGRIRASESVLYDLCPHDLSLILAITGTMPQQVSCFAASHITQGVADWLAAGLGFADGVTAALQTSWMSPYKEHRLTVTGSAGALVFDDTKPWPEKLILYHDTIRQAGDLFDIERAEPVCLPVAEAEPLRAEISCFATVCASGQPAPTGAEDALQVQEVLSMLEAKMGELRQ